ncbi:MAG TPA: hypothetical protein VFZ59_10055 [Verrucomicrobiae bacterium]|nr:hypothetical protein [Verrucomicrobiae bacterium]
MKTSHLLMLAGLAAGIIVLGWQTCTILELRTEVASLRKDLQTAAETALGKPVGFSSPESDQERREKLELIKLRHQVRELNERVIESHARERMANARTVLRSLLPSAASSGPWKFRPEWIGMESQATNQYAQAMSALASATNEYVKFLCLDRAREAEPGCGPD